MILQVYVDVYHGWSKSNRNLRSTDTAIAVGHHIPHHCHLHFESWYFAENTRKVNVVEAPFVINTVEAPFVIKHRLTVDCLRKAQRVNPLFFLLSLPLLDNSSPALLHVPPLQLAM